MRTITQRVFLASETRTLKRVELVARGRETVEDFRA